MAKQFFSDLPSTTTPLTADRLNGLLDGEEAMGNIVVDSIKSNNLFDYTMTPFRYSATRVMPLSTEGIRVVATGTGTYSTVGYKVLDIEQHLGKRLTLSCTVNVATAQPRIAWGTCDANGENREIISFQDISTNGRYSLSILLPSSVTSTNKYLALFFYISHGTATAVGDYSDFNNIQLNIGEDTIYYPYMELNTNNFAKFKLFSFGNTSGQVIDTGIATNRSFGGIALILGTSTNTIETFGRRWWSTTTQSNFVTSNSNMIKEDGTTRTMTITSQNTSSDRVLIFYN